MRAVRRRILLLVLVVLILAALGVLGLILAAPEVVNVLPEDGSRVPAGSDIRITFSDPMQADSTEARFLTIPAIPGEFRWDAETLIFTPARSLESGTDITIQLAAGARAANGLGLPTLQAKEVTFTVAQPQVAYLYPANGPADLYSLDIETGETTRMTNVPGGILSYSAAADGQILVFATRGGALFIHDRKNGESTLLDDCAQASCSDPQISSDRRYLAYVRTPDSQSAPRAYPQVWLRSLDGGEPFLADESALFTELPGWSASGWLAYYDRINQRFSFWNPDSNERREVSNQTGEIGAWSPDASSYTAPEIFLIPNAYLGTGGGLEPMPTSHLLKFNLESGENIDLTGDDTLEDTTPSIAPEGGQLVFGRKYLDPGRWTPGRQIWRMAIDGTSPIQLSDDPFFNHTAFAWKPDSSQVLYVRSNQTNLSEPPEIWLMQADGSQPLRLVIGGYAPKWIP